MFTRIYAFNTHSTSLFVINLCCGKATLVYSYKKPRIWRRKNLCNANLQ